ncbi:hypothetical protein M3Y99_01602900 [Aphelenchoides fujianensis]|nr:hypothetical protein M3Y99_01602900 [Aphelenchoides fujianensis]
MKSGSLFFLCAWSFIALTFAEPLPYGIIIGTPKTATLCDADLSNSDVWFNLVLKRLCKNRGNNHVTRYIVLAPEYDELEGETPGESLLNKEESEQSPEMSMFPTPTKRRMYARIGKRQMFKARVG